MRPNPVLRRSDGTAAGTEVINAVGFNTLLQPRGLVAFGPWVYFAGMTPDAGMELMRTDVVLPTASVVKRGPVDYVRRLSCPLRSLAWQGLLP